MPDSSIRARTRCRCSMRSKNTPQAASAASFFGRLLWTRCWNGWKTSQNRPSTFCTSTAMACSIVREGCRSALRNVRAAASPLKKLPSSSKTQPMLLRQIPAISSSKLQTVNAILCQRPNSDRTFIATMLLSSFCRHVSQQRLRKNQPRSMRAKGRTQRKVRWAALLRVSPLPEFPPSLR